MLANASKRCHMPYLTGSDRAKTARAQSAGFGVCQSFFDPASQFFQILSGRPSDEGQGSASPAEVVRSLSVLLTSASVCLRTIYRFALLCHISRPRMKLINVKIKFRQTSTNRMISIGLLIHSCDKAGYLTLSGCYAEAK